MPRKRKWQHELEASRQEALLAVDLYNRAGNERRLEAFVVHMHVAWLYLLHAHFEQTKVDYWYREPDGKRARGKGGQPRTWDLARCLRHQFKENDPVRRNAEFFIGLRDKIEHRYERALTPVLAGKCQAHVLNYEETVVRLFEPKFGLADQLRFPVFLSSLTEDAVKALKLMYERLPKGITRYVETFDSALPEEVRGDYRYELRITLIPETGPPSSSDVAMRFVRWDDMTDEQRSELERMQTIIREKRVPVSGKDYLRASDVARRVQQELGVTFSVYGEHVRAWHHYKVRPAESDPGPPDRTKSEFCVWDKPHNDYLYTEAWVRFLVKELQSPKKFEVVTGHPPYPVI